MKHFKSWNWRFGRTPKFKVHLRLSVGDILSRPDTSSECLEINLDVDTGVIQNISLDVPSSFLNFITNDMLNSVTSKYLKRVYTDHLLSALRQDILDFFRDKFNDERLSDILQ